jgi:hypothetical protein
MEVTSDVGLSKLMLGKFLFRIELDDDIAEVI